MFQTEEDATVLAAEIGVIIGYFAGVATVGLILAAYTWYKRRTSSKGAQKYDSTPTEAQSVVPTDVQVEIEGTKAKPEI